MMHPIRPLGFALSTLIALTISTPLVSSARADAPAVRAREGAGDIALENGILAIPPEIAEAPPGDGTAQDTARMQTPGQTAVRQNRDRGDSLP